MKYEEFLNELLPNAPSWAIQIIVEELLNRDDRIVELKGIVEELEKKNEK